MKVAVMQPYFFPYLGYFQMVQAVDHFVFYDDVNFIKRGWINRNRILVNGQPHYLSVQLIGASQNKKINEIELTSEKKNIIRQLKMLEMNYRKAPFFSQVYPLVESIMCSEYANIGEMAALSVIGIADYLEISTAFHFSSQLSFGHKASNRAQRLIDITKGFNASNYLNAEGGKELYQKEEFEQQGLQLQFIKSQLPIYAQSTKDFVPGLSIIDILMHNSKQEVMEMLLKFELN